MNINEFIKDLVDIVKSNKEPNYELLFRDAFKRGFSEGIRYEYERIKELLQRQ